MTRTKRGLLAAVLVGVFAVGMPLPSNAGSAPLRSGTLLSGVFYVGNASDCRHVADCLAWLHSGCDPALAGRDPAWTASIEDVADLADGSTPRTLQFRVEPGSVGWGGVAVQFWRESCSEVSHTRGRWKRASDRSPTGLVVLSGRTWTTLRIPSDAKWMTVTTHDTVHIKWTLT